MNKRHEVTYIPDVLNNITKEPPISKEEIREAKKDQFESMA